VFEYIIEFHRGALSGRRTTEMHSGTGDPMCADMFVGAFGMLDLAMSAGVAR
jgi:hypothetical protein